MTRWLAVLLVCLPLQAGAEVMHYNLCTIRPDKTLADLNAWTAEWKALIAKHKIDYRLRILLPHADSQIKLDQFFLEGGSPTLLTYARAWDWWYTNAEAQALNAKLVALSACESGAVYTSVD